MSKKAVLLPAIVAVISSMLTMGVWLSIAPASATPAKTVVSNISFKDIDTGSYTVAPGDTTEAFATCPKEGAWAAVGGAIS